MDRFTMTCVAVLLMVVQTARAELPPPPTDLSPWPMTESPSDPGEASAADWIDAPAGRLGPVVVKDGHFFTGPNRLKLWGVNLAFSANFPTHAEADRLAVRFRRFGVNAVRFHHMDNQPFPNGIFADNSLTTLSPEALDRLDYFISVLKAQGVYADLNLHVSRNYRHLHGPAGGGDGPAVDKIVDLFDPLLITSQKQYAKDLLTHVNAYTKNRYADESCVAIVEINNENSLFMWGSRETIAKLPEPYAAELKKQWNGWLLSKYKTDEALEKSWATGEEPIGKPVSEDPAFLSEGGHGRHSWAAEVHEPAAMSVTPIKGGGVKLNVTAVDGTDWHLQYAQSNLHVTAGSAYVVRVTARAEHPTTISVAVGQAHAPWQLLGLGTQIQLTDADQTFDLPFTATESDDKARVSFSLGKAIGAIAISSAQMMPGGRLGLTEGQSAAGGSVEILTPKINPTEIRRDDWTNFLVETERGYYTGMRQYLKTELGVKCPITGTIGFGPDAVKAQSNMDFVDGHAYWEHPSFPHRQWDMADWRMDNQAMVDHVVWFPHAMIDDFGMRQDASTLGALPTLRDPIRPYTVTEYQHPAPNDWRAEGLPMIATRAARDDWDGVFIFAYSHDPKYAKDKISSFFDIEGDPVKMAMMPAAARMFFGQLEQQSILANGTRGWRPIPAWKQHDGLNEGAGGDGPGTGILAAIDDHAGVFVGFNNRLPHLLPYDLGIAKLDSLESPFASIVVQMEHPHDDNAILITAVARAENTGMGWNADRTSVGNHWGTTPVLIETVKATISFTGDWKHAHPLDPAGNALPDEVGSVVDGRFVVKLGGRPAVAYIVTK